MIVSNKCGAHTPGRVLSRSHAALRALRSSETRITLPPIRGSEDEAARPWTPRGGAAVLPARPLPSAPRPPFRGLASQALPPGPWLTLDTPRCTSALWSRPIIFLRLFPVSRSQRHRHLLRKPPQLASPEQPPGPAVARDVPVCISSQPPPPRAQAVRMRPRAQPAKQAPQGRGAASAQRPLQSHA